MGKYYTRKWGIWEFGDSKLVVGPTPVGVLNASSLIILRGLITNAPPVPV